MKALLWILRFIVGILFIFSGLIKANDPLGLSYKMQEFFEVLNIHFLSPYALAFSILMIAFEIIAGVAVIVGYAYRFFSFLLLILIIFFTFLTGFALFSGKIKECGCFGDCIKLTANESFWKDIILLVLILVLFVYRNKVKPLFNTKISWIILGLTTIFSFGMQWYVLKHLPIKDCLAYKKGNNIWEKMQVPPGSTPDVYETRLIYAKDGVEKEFTQDNFPWEDSTWVFVDSKTTLVKEGNGKPEILDFGISDYEGNSYTESVLHAPGLTYLFLIMDPLKASTENADKIKALFETCQQNGTPFYVLASDNKANTEAFLSKLGITTPDIYTLDRTVSKTALRANPGVILLEKGTVLGKWSSADYPEYKKY